MAVVAAGCLAAPTLRAEQAVALSYQAPAGCASETEFTQAVAARGGQLTGEQAAAHAKRLEVTVRAVDAGFVGSLRVETRDGPSSEREVRAADCREVVEGLSVVAALALGGDGANSATGAGTTVPAVAVATPAPTPAAPPKAETEEKPRLRGSAFQQPPERVDVDAGSLRFDRARTYTLTAGAAFGVVPNLVLPRYDLSFSVANFVTPPNQPSYLVGTVFGVDWTWLGPATRRDGDLSTQVYGMKAGVHACAPLTYDEQGLTLLFCSGFGAGFIWLDTKSSDGTYAKGEDAGFGYAGINFDTSYSFSKLFHVNLRAGGEMQAGSLTASRPDGSELFQHSYFSGFVAAGLGLHF